MLRPPRRSSPTRRAVAFDLGGVLYDVDVPRAARAAARSLEVDAGRIEPAVFGNGLWQRLEVGDVDGDAFLQAVLERLELPRSAARTEELRQAWCAILTLRPGVDALLARVAAPCLVWSNTDPIHAARIRGEPALHRRVQRWSVSYELGVEKPCADFFQRALAQAALEPWQVVYVDDRGENVAQARALGVDAFEASALPAVWAGLHARGLLRP